MIWLKSTSNFVNIMAILFTVRLCKNSNSYLIRTFFCTNIKVRGGRQQGPDHVQEIVAERDL